MTGNEKRIAENRELVRKFPFLKPADDERYDFEWTYLDDIPEGWKKAFGEQMCAEIAECLREHHREDGFEILQAKEKYGSLRLYTGGGPSELDDIIGKYEELSAKTCVGCGKPAEYISIGWIAPWCGDCAMENAKEGAFPQKYVKVSNWFGGDKNAPVMEGDSLIAEIKREKGCEDNG